MDGDDGRAVRAGSFELCDGEGRVRALLGLGPGGLVALDLADEAGRVRASLAVGGDGSVSLKLSDADGRYRAGLGAWGDGSAGLDLWDRETRHRVSLADGAGVGVGVPSGVTLFDTAGTLRALLAFGPEPDRDASVEFWD